MGNNSVFDDLGIGASDLGLSEDPDDVARANQAELDRQQSEIDSEKFKTEEERKVNVEKERKGIEKDRKEGASRSRTILTSASGLSDSDENITRKTLLGS